MNDKKNILKDLSLHTKAFYTIRWYIISAIILSVIFLGAILIIQKYQNDTEKTKLVKDMTYQKTFRLTGLGVQERYNVYLDFCIRVWNVYGNTYHRPSKKYPVPQAMDNDTRSKIWRLNFELAEMMNFTENGRGYYSIIIKGILESDLNPNNVGPYGERTWLQLKEIAVLQAKGVYECMIPARWKNKLRFDYSGDMTTLTSEDAIKIAYLLAWYYKRCYGGQKIWYVSLYHWGHGFLGVHFRNGYGVIPSHFVINKIQYDPLGYYISHQTMEDSFANGDIEAGRTVQQHWADRRKQIIKEERAFIETKKEFDKIKNKVKNFEETLEEKDRLIIQGRKDIEDLKNTLKNADVKFRKTYLGAKNWKGGNIREFIWNSGKDIAKSMKKHVDYRKENMTFLITIGSTILIYLIMQTLMIIFSIKYIKMKRGKNE